MGEEGGGRGCVCAGVCGLYAVLLGGRLRGPFAALLLVEVGPVRLLGLGPSAFASGALEVG